jgi:hypothetical protein
VIIVTSLGWPSGLLVDRAVTTEQQRYFAYMLRPWQVSSDRDPIWRASVESPHTGERHGFANLERLFAFLGEKTVELAQREEPAKDISEN